MVSMLAVGRWSFHLIRPISGVKNDVFCDLGNALEAMRPFFQ